MGQICVCVLIYRNLIYTYQIFRMNSMSIQTSSLMFNSNNILNACVVSVSKQI